MIRSPFNCLINPETAKITAILDWDNSIFGRLGYNFRFAEALFVCIILNGASDEERATTEDAIYARMLELVMETGTDMPGNFNLALEMWKVLGGLSYYVPKMNCDALGLRETALGTVALHWTSWKQTPRSLTIPRISCN